MELENNIENNDTSANEREGSDNLIVADLLRFRTGILDQDWKFLAETFLTINGESLAIALSILGPIMVHLAGFVCMNILQDKDMQAAFGIFESFIMIFFSTVIISFVDKLGMNMSLAFGKQDFLSFRVSFVQGCVCCALIFLLFCVPSVFIGSDLLRLIGVSQQIANFCKMAFRWFLPNMVLQAAFEVLKTACMSQGHEVIFGIVGIASASTAFALTYVLMVVYELGFLGWVAAMTFFNLINLATALVILTRLEKGSIGLITFSELTSGFLPFFFESIKFCFSTYSELLGIEIVTIYVARTHDNHQIAALAGIMNFATIIYTIGVSYSIIFRTRANTLLGMEEKQAAKNTFKFFYMTEIIIAITLGIIVFFFRETLANVYCSATIESKNEFMMLAMIYSLAFPSEFTNFTIAAGMKANGIINIIVYLNFALMLVVNMIVNHLLSGIPVRAWAHFSTVFIILYVISICMSTILFMIEWRTGNVDNEEPDTKNHIVYEQLDTDRPSNTVYHKRVSRMNI